MSVQLSSLNIPAGAPAPRPDAAGRVSGASVNAAAALRNFQMHPRLDYGTITGVNGPLVILDNVKVSARPCARTQPQTEDPPCARGVAPCAYLDD